MDNSQVRISVVIFTYNQEQLISRALDSILDQKEYGLYQIVVCDDCSPDGTWGVIQHYKELYPDIIVAHRNEQNKGIYGNIAVGLEIVKQSDTDFLIQCAGDDCVGTGYFKAIQEFIRNKSIDVHNRSLVIYCNHKIVWEDGREHNIVNPAIETYPRRSAVSLRMNRLLAIAGSAVSKGCLERYDSFPTDKGVSMAEEFCDIQQTIWSDNDYYIPFIGYAHYMNIGVSTKMGNKKNRTERIEAWNAILDYAKIDGPARHRVMHDINRLKFSNHKSISLFIKTWWHYVLSRYNISIRYAIREAAYMICTKYDKVVC